MKKLLLLTYFSLSLLTAKSQIVLEHRYLGSPGFNNFTTTKFSSGELKYVTTSGNSSPNAPNGTPNPVVTIYNENHSVFKQMTVPTIVGSTLTEVSNVSDRLFNQDASIEYVAIYSRRPHSTGAIYRAVVLTETGTQLLVADSLSSDGPLNVIKGSAGIKLTIPTARLDASGNGVFPYSYTKVYSLGGSYIPTNTLKAAPSESLTTETPYPNPTSAKINLPYEVALSKQARLEVLDMVGRVVKNYTVDSTFKNLQLDSNELRAGTYTYRVIDDMGVSVKGHKFVVE